MSDQLIIPNAYELHKPIRNRIRRYNCGSMLGMALNVLLRNEESFGAENGYIPWECMLLIRWVLQYGDTSFRAREPTIQIINRLLNDIKDLHNDVLPIETESPHWVHKFMRRMAFQQFIYQMPLNQMGWKGGRQIILFEEMGAEYGVNEKFKSNIGISVKEFLALSFAVFSVLNKDGVHAIFKKNNFEEIFSPEVVERFFDQVSVTPREAKEYLDEDSKRIGKRFVLQLYEISPLVHKPFLKLEDRYVIFSKRLFRQFFANYIYDYLYSLPDKFSEFGDILEKYMNQRLKEANVDFLVDSEWKKIFGKQVSVPDFTISEDCATILIESKRKELPTIPKVFQTNDAMSKNLDDSIVKGVLQIYSLAHELSLSDKNIVKNNSNFYGVVVTYKDHYLRGGQQFWDEFLEEEVTKELTNSGIDVDLMPPENIFLLSVDEFDHLLCFLENNPEMNFSKVFEQVKIYEEDPRTTSFFFNDHLVRMGDERSSYPEFLWEKMNALIENLTEKTRDPP